MPPPFETHRAPNGVIRAESYARVPHRQIEIDERLHSLTLKHEYIDEAYGTEFTAPRARVRWAARYETCISRVTVSVRS